MASLEHDLIVASVPSVIGAWATWWGARNHRSLRRLHRQIDPGKGPDGKDRTLVSELAEMRADMMSLGVLFGQHLVNDHDYDRERPTPLQRRPQRRNA